MTPTMQAITQYSELIDSSVKYELSEWRYRWGTSQTIHSMWVGKAQSHYEYATEAELLDALRIKTLLHYKF